MRGGDTVIHAQPEDPEKRGKNFNAVEWAEWKLGGKGSLT